MNHPILLLTTGGIIDKQHFDALSRYQITPSSPNSLPSHASPTPS